MLSLGVYVMMVEILPGFFHVCYVKDEILA